MLAEISPTTTFIRSQQPTSGCLDKAKQALWKGLEPLQRASGAIILLKWLGFPGVWFSLVPWHCVAGTQWSVLHRACAMALFVGPATNAHVQPESSPTDDSKPEGTRCETNTDRHTNKCKHMLLFGKKITSVTWDATVSSQQYWFAYIDFKSIRPSKFFWWRKQKCKSNNKHVCTQSC